MCIDSVAFRSQVDIGAELILTASFILPRQIYTLSVLKRARFTLQDFVHRQRDFANTPNNSANNDALCSKTNLFHLIANKLI
ncbi:MAG: hypothetical protein AAB336_02070 [Acidobacteriota bacterium]